MRRWVPEGAPVAAGSVWMPRIAQCGPCEEEFGERVALEAPAFHIVSISAGAWRENCCRNAHRAQRLGEVACMRQRRPRFMYVALEPPTLVLQTVEVVRQLRVAHVVAHGRRVKEPGTWSCALMEHSRGLAPTDKLPPIPGPGIARHWPVETAGWGPARLRRLYTAPGDVRCSQPLRAPAPGQRAEQGASLRGASDSGAPQCRLRARVRQGRCGGWSGGAPSKWF